MDAQHGPNLVFYEEQKFTQLWLWITILAIFGFLLYSSRIWREEFVFAAAVPTLVYGFIIWLLAAARMVTEVRPDGVTVSARPFRRLRRTIPFDQITSCEARDYRPIREYGGWGIRIGRGGKAYNMSGSRGVQLVLTSGERVLIGSQKADELAAEVKSRIRG